MAEERNNDGRCRKHHGVDNCFVDCQQCDEQRCRVLSMCGHEFGGKRDQFGGNTDSCYTAALSSQPSSKTLNMGSVAVFSASATGTAPLSYVWAKNRKHT